MFLAKDWELIHTDSLKKRKNEDLVDQINIDKKNKRFFLQLNGGYYITDGYDCTGEIIYSSSVSREVFDIIVEGVKAKGYREIKDFREI